MVEEMRLLFAAIANPTFIDRYARKISKVLKGMAEAMGHRSTKMHPSYGGHSCTCAFSTQRKTW